MKAPCTEPCGDSSCLPCPPGTFLARDSHFKTDCTRCQVCDEEGKGVACPGLRGQALEDSPWLVLDERGRNTGSIHHHISCLSPFPCVLPVSTWPWPLVSHEQPTYSTCGVSQCRSPREVIPCFYVVVSGSDTTSPVPTFLHPLSQPFR